MTQQTLKMIKIDPVYYVFCPKLLEDNMSPAVEHCLFQASEDCSNIVEQVFTVFEEFKAPMPPEIYDKFALVHSVTDKVNKIRTNIFCRDEAMVPHVLHSLEQKGLLPKG